MLQLQWCGRCTSLLWWRESWAQKQSFQFTIWSTSPPSPMVMRFEWWLKEWDGGYKQRKLAFSEGWLAFNLDIGRGVEPSERGSEYSHYTTTSKGASWGGLEISQGCLLSAYWVRCYSQVPLGGDRRAGPGHAGGGGWEGGVDCST